MVSFKVLTRLRDYFERLGVGFVAPTEKLDWGLVFSSELAPPPEGSAPTNRVYDPIPGRVFKAARVAGGWRQEEFAARAGIGHTTVRRLEKSDVTVRPELAYILQKKFEDDGFLFVKPDGLHGWRLFVPPLGDRGRH